MKKLFFSILFPALATTFTSLAYEIPLSYYSSLDGKCGEQLKTAIHELVTDNVTVLSYGSGSKNTWWGFYVTDYIETANGREVLDRYSNDVRYYGDRGNSVSGMNIEHSFPKSWWGGSQNNAYKDLFNLMPCEAKINNSKSNYAMGVVVTASANNGCTKVGTGDGGTKYWEPADKWKGDFARDYMYMATAYQNFTWEGEGLTSLVTGAYPTFQKWAYELYLKWARNDEVDDIETSRNQAVSEIQGNRNPFVDFPNLMEYVWGDSISTPLKLATTLKAGHTVIADPELEAEEILNLDFTNSNAGGFTTDGTSGVWSKTKDYGWKASAYVSSTETCKPSDASIISSEIDLSAYRSATMTFSHAANKFNTGSPADFLSVNVISDGGTAHEVDVPKWPSGKNWTFVESGNVDLSPYCGHKVKVQFHYTSTSDVAGTWEIKSLKVSGVKATTAIEDIETGDEDAPAEYYNIQGVRVTEPLAPGIYIIRRGNTVTKAVIR